MVQAIVESSLASTYADDKFQFERHGYFGCGITLLRKVRLRRNAPARCVADRVAHAAGKPVFNLAVGLKDSWGK